ncbi:MAG: hypothetical protein RL308_1936 [Bacteroidota bacterium]|jgi:hypothetical protein
MNSKKWTILILGILFCVSRIIISKINIDLGYFMDFYISIFLLVCLFFIEKKYGDKKTRLLSLVSTSLAISIFSMVLFELYKISIYKGDINDYNWLNRLMAIGTILSYSLLAALCYKLIFAINLNIKVKS